MTESVPAIIGVGAGLAEYYLLNTRFQFARVSNMVLGVIGAGMVFAKITGIMDSLDPRISDGIFGNGLALVTAAMSCEFLCGEPPGGVLPPPTPEYISSVGTGRGMRLRSPYAYPCSTPFARL